MNLRWISWLVNGVIISTLMFPMVVRADSNSPSYLPPALGEIQLTPEQQAQLKALREQVQSDLDDLLTTEEKTQFQDSISQGNDIRSTIRSMDVSFRKRRQIGKVFKGMKSELEDILTREQMAQLEENLQSRQN